MCKWLVNILPFVILQAQPGDKAGLLQTPGSPPAVAGASPKSPTPGSAAATANQKYAVTPQVVQEGNEIWCLLFLCVYLDWET